MQSELDKEKVCYSGYISLSSTKMKYLIIAKLLSARLALLNISNGKAKKPPFSSKESLLPGPPGRMYLTYMGCDVWQVWCFIIPSQAGDAGLNSSLAHHLCLLLR